MTAGRRPSAGPVRGEVYLVNRPFIPDVVTFLQSAEKWIGDELDLAEMQARDRLLVCTKNICYLFVMTGRHTTDLTPDRVDRPGGPVQIQGCAFGGSKMIKPGHLFCGAPWRSLSTRAAARIPPAPSRPSSWSGRHRDLDCTRLKDCGQAGVGARGEKPSGRGVTPARPRTRVEKLGGITWLDWRWGIPAGAGD